MRSSSATEIMNPAESATMFSRARTLHREWATTAAAPITLALAATAVYVKARVFNRCYSAGIQNAIGGLALLWVDWRRNDTKGRSMEIIMSDVGLFRTTIGIENLARGAVRDVADALVDTGSDLTWIPRSVLESLGVGVERRSRRALPRIRSPQPFFERRALLEVHAAQQIHPAIGPGVDEELELRAQRDLILGREQGDFHAAVGRQRNLETRHGVTHIGKRHHLPRPRALRPLVADEDVDGRLHQLAQRIKEIHHPLGVCYNLGLVDIAGARECEAVLSRSESFPDRRVRCLRAKERHVGVSCASLISRSRAFCPGSLITASRSRRKVTPTCGPVIPSFARSVPSIARSASSIASL